MNALLPMAAASASDERALQDALRRGLRSPGPAALIAVHLSGQPAGILRPHRARVARAILDDAAAGSEGEVFALANGDLVLLARRPRGGSALVAAALAPPLIRLFGLSGAAAAGLLSCWKLEDAAEAALLYAQARLGEVAADHKLPDPLPAPPAAAGRPPRAWPHTALAGAAPHSWLARHAAVRIAAGAEAPRLLHHALMVPPALLDTQAPEDAAEIADPDLHRHLLASFSTPLLADLAALLAAPTSLLRRMAARAPLHLALGLSAIGSTGFRQLATVARQNGVALGVDVALVEAAADPAGFMRIRHFLTGQGIGLAVCGVDSVALDLSEPERLAPDLLKLDWSPALGWAGARVAALTAILGTSRVVLAATSDDSALRWGLMQGFSRFQGPRIAALLAAARQNICPHAAACTAGQCGNRALALTFAGRSGCASTELLDRAVP